MNNHSNTNLNNDLDNKLNDLNIPGTVIEVIQAEAEELGAFEEDALDEADALEANDVENNVEDH
ncbi:conjugal transfer protein TraD [Parashewanella tropica]|uniref:conjugal transfer protein TraD n=1 Tax=Parashewanella tropica TaxID=2547970 RepID=UPI001059753C|nr:conjugal transfer protein TraD [Parashewanella tropica]